MLLGEKLKKTLKELERAKIFSLDEQAAADMKKIRQERADTELWLDQIKQNLIDQIEKDQIPLEKIKDHHWQSWLNQAKNGKAANSDLWNKFKQFWNKEGLEPVLEEAHDGMGMQSWINLTVKILPPRARGDEDIGVYNG
jgi:transcriptional accessory protein Tex/SPT6